MAQRETSPAEREALSLLGDAQREYDAAWRALQETLEQASWMPGDPRVRVEAAQARVMEAGRRLRQAGEHLRSLRRRAA